ncbi:MAG TPA: hypothetical protein VFQ53_27485 [Kofleriaceae bacterium]|nr:hypothetical protein [Kofleriaceae bacterium]
MRRTWLVTLLYLVACSSSSPGGDDDHGPGDGGGDGPITPPGPRLIPGPDETGFDPALAAKAHAYDRQFRVFAAMPFGLSLDAQIPDPGDRALVTAFLQQDATDDFAAFTAAQGTPRSVRDIVAFYDEHGDLGMFAGAAAAGEAFRYMALRGRASVEEIDQARADLLRAIESFHVAATITGTPGTVARGIRRLDEPGEAPATEPPPSSCPQPGDRGNRWRPDGSGQHPELIYNDNNSKDQIIGYVFALGAFWDAIANDPAIPQATRDQVQADALALARSLMQPVQLGFTGQADLVIRDWHDCPTKHLDLNPRVVPIDGFDPLVLSETATNQNGWNALASLGVVRTLYHVTGDAEVGRYYYDELVGRRDFPRLAVTGPARTSAMYQDGNLQTNFSNVNMAFTAAYGVLRYESDPALRATYEQILATELWDAGHPHDAASMQQAFFNLIYAAFRTAGNDVPSTTNATTQLGEFVAPPYFDAVVENCDGNELAAGSCLAIDGTTTIMLVAPGQAKSRDPVPKRVRPPSNFEWRSDPRDVNGGGSIRLDPGGDFRSAYWMGRILLDATAGADNLSPVARPRP